MNATLKITGDFINELLQYEYEGSVESDNLFTLKEIVRRQDTYDYENWKEFNAIGCY